MTSRIPLLIASGFGIGLIPGAPGTYASLVTVLCFSLVYLVSFRIVPELHVSTVCLISLAGVLASSAVARQRGDEDPSVVVIDEIAGQLLTFVFVPVNVAVLPLGFVLFRLFDIWKPFPIRRLESLPGGVGIMADDLLAGIYANLVLHAVVRIA
jgi:phosphatidylglycerophosphatase A